MENLSDIQLSAITVMQAAEEHLEEMIELLSSKLSSTMTEKYELLTTLRGLVETSIKYGQLKSTHERLLKDVTSI
jgi:hypothetical protein